MDYGDSALHTSAQPGRAVPFSLEAEQSVLGAILLEPSCLNVVMDLLPREEYFYGVNNQLIYGAMREMFVLGEPVDFVTVLEKLKENRDFDQDTGKVYLTQLAQLVPSIDNVEVYAQIVRDKYDLRTLMQAARSILDEASEGSEEPSLLLDAAEEKIYRIRQGKTVRGLQKLSEVLLETFDRLDRLNSPDKDQYQGLPTGIRELDSTITGLNRSDLIIVAARPGVGKTSLALNIARHVAVTKGRKVAFFSLEMGKEQLASRLLASEALVEGTKLRSGDLSNDEWTRLVEASDILGKAPLYLDDSPDINRPEDEGKASAAEGRGPGDGGLPPADDQPQAVGQPRQRSGGDHPEPEDHGQRAERPRGGPVPAAPPHRAHQGPPPRPFRAAGLRLYRTGRRHCNVPPSGGLQRHQRGRGDV